MKTISLNLPEIIFTTNSIDLIKKEIGNHTCIVFTSKYWTDNIFFKNLKKNIKFLDIIQNIDPNPEINKVFDISLNLQDVSFVLCIGGGSVIDFTKAVLAFNSIKKSVFYLRLIIL